MLVESCETDEKEQGDTSSNSLEKPTCIFIAGRRAEIKVLLSGAAWSTLSLFAQVMHITSEFTRGASPFSNTYICTKVPFIFPFIPSLGLLKGVKIYRLWGWKSFFEILGCKNWKGPLRLSGPALSFYKGGYHSPLEKHLVCYVCL